MTPVGGRILAALLVLATAPGVLQAQPPPGGPPPPPQPARQSAALDLTGQWVAIVNEDWRWRMVTPPKGDYASVPLNAEGRRVADTWEPAKDGACEAYGAAGVMRMPTRLRVSWDGDETLKIETDAGGQTRTLNFKPASAASTARSLQGQSRAEWVRPQTAPGGPGLAGAGGGAGGRAGGYLKVTTTNLLPGWLRKNGPPVQRGRVADGVLRPVQDAERRRMVDGDGDRRRPGLLEHALRHELALQARADRRPMESPAVRCPMNAAESPMRTFAAIWLAAAVLGGASPARAQQRARIAAPPPEKIEVWPVRDNLYMLVGAGGNTTVQIGADGVLIVDTKLAAASDALLAAVRGLSDKPIRYVINTHVHPDHVGGNEKIATAGSTIAGGNVSGAIADASVGAAVLAHENVLVRMSGQEPPPPFTAWPTDTFFVPEKDFFFNGEAVQVMHKPAAHTDGDSIVFFRRSDVISAGDVFTTTMYPVIRAEDGGGIDGVIAALNDIIALTVPAEKQEGGTMVIPGHGRLADEADVVEYRDMLTIVRDRVGSMIEMGMTLRQVQAAQPTRDYDGRYGATEGLWTTAQFVEAVYNDLADAASGAKSAAARE